MVIKTKKNKIVNNKRSQKGRGLFTTEVKVYSNIKLKDGSFVLNNLACNVKGCNGKAFKHHKVKLGTLAKSFLLDTDFFDNKYNAFTCINCGCVQFYSGRVEYESEKIGKSGK